MVKPVLFCAREETETIQASPLSKADAILREESEEAI